MKRLGTALAVAMATFAVMGCNDYGNTFQSPTGARISSLSPQDVPAGSVTDNFTLTVNGAGFVKGTVVQWNEKTIPSQLQTDSSGNVIGITATVAAALVATPGTAYVNTLSPHSGAGTNGLSNSVAFIIDPPKNPPPTLSSISPTTAPAGSQPFVLTVSGSNFIPAGSNMMLCQNAPNTTPCGSSVNWNMGPTQTTFNTFTTPSVNMTITSTTITLTIPAANVAASGCAVVTVYNPPSSPSGTASGGGGGTSVNGKTFTVGNATCSSAAAKASSAMTGQAVEETPAVSVDGRYVTYTVLQNDYAQVFVRDTCEGAAAGCQARTLLISAAADGSAGNADSRSPSMSSDGRYVAYSSAASNLVADAPAGRQIYLRDTCFGADSSTCKPYTQIVSVDASGALVGSEAILPSVSASGRFVAFVAVTPSHAKKDLTAQAKPGGNSANSGYRQVFVRDTCLGATNCTPKTTRISLQPGEAPAEAKPAGPALSGSAKQVALPDVSASTVFTRGIAVDDRVFLALTEEHR